MTSRPGITRTDSVLDRIVADKRQELERRKGEVSESELLQEASEYDQQWSLTTGIRAPRGSMPPSSDLQIIAEIKKASPSKGVLAPTLDYKLIAAEYASAGAVGISVLTEVNYFLGSLEWLRDVRLLLQAEFPDSRPSLLRKDFVVEPYEIVEARAYGADNVLLIAALLDRGLLQELITMSTEVGLDALVEVHNEDEAERAMAAGARLFGINNRDLHTFNVDLSTTERIRPLLPKDATVVGESGVHTREDSARLLATGVQAILVGEAFMTSPNIPTKMAELRV